LAGQAAKRKAHEILGWGEALRGRGSRLKKGARLKKSIFGKEGGDRCPKKPRKSRRGRKTKRQLKVQEKGKRERKKKLRLKEGNFKKESKKAKKSAIHIRQSKKPSAQAGGKKERGQGFVGRGTGSAHRRKNVG